jgi:predicted DNA-binding ribbon-helix-helix protein
MQSTIVKRSIVIAGHKSSVSLEDAFWKGLKEIARERDMTLSDLVSSIDSARQQGNLSSAIRLFVLNHYQNDSATTLANGLRRAMSLQRERRPNSPAPEWATGLQKKTPRERGADSSQT